MFQWKKSRHGFGKKWVALFTLLCCGLLAGSCISPEAPSVGPPSSFMGDPSDPTKAIE